MAKRKSEEYLWPRTLTHSSILLYQLYKITHVIGKKCKNQVWLQPEFITLNLQTLRLRYYARFITVDRPLSRHDERVGFQKGKEGKVATTRILAHNLVPTWYKISPFFALPTLIFVIAWFQQYFMMIIITMKHGKILPYFRWKNVLQIRIIW